MKTDVNINLSPRLLDIYKAIDFNIGDFLDIGSDHGYLPIYLYKNEYSYKIYASENKLGPFNRLRKEVDKYNCQIECLYGDGLEVYLPNIKQVCISGMGGNNIVKILSSKNLNNISYLIIEPQSDFYLVRKYLYEHNFKCKDEFYIKEKSHYYPVMIYINGKDQSIYTSFEFEYGKIALNKKDKVLLEYLNKKYIINERLICLKTRNLYELEKENNEIRKVLDYEQSN